MATPMSIQPPWKREELFSEVDQADVAIPLVEILLKMFEDVCRGFRLASHGSSTSAFGIKTVLDSGEGQYDEGAYDLNLDRSERQCLNIVVL